MAEEGKRGEALLVCALSPSPRRSPLKTPSASQEAPSSLSEPGPAPSLAENGAEAALVSSPPQSPRAPRSRERKGAASLRDFAGSAESDAVPARFDETSPAASSARCAEAEALQGGASPTKRRLAATAEGVARADERVSRKCRTHPPSTSGGHRECLFADALRAYNLASPIVCARDSQREASPSSLFGLGEWKAGLWTKGASGAGARKQREGGGALRGLLQTEEQLSGVVRWFAQHCLAPETASASTEEECEKEEARPPPLSALRTCRYVGLDNLGATCYINVYLQTLFMNPHFRDLLLLLPTAGELAEEFGRRGSLDEAGEVAAEEEAEGAAPAGQNFAAAPSEEPFWKAAAKKWLSPSRYSLVAALQRLFALLQTGTRRAVKPDVLAELLAEDLSCEEDANELQHRLFEMLEAELGGPLSPFNFIPTLFRGRSISEVTCRSCSYTGRREETFCQLTCCKRRSSVSREEKAAPAGSDEAPRGAGGSSTEKEKEKERGVGERGRRLSKTQPPPLVETTGSAEGEDVAEISNSGASALSPWSLEEDLHRQFLRCESLRGDCKYFCPSCGEKREARKRVRLSLLPPYLQVVVLRYSVEVTRQTGEWTRKKIHEELQVPMELDLAHCCADDCLATVPPDAGLARVKELPVEASRYKLFAALEHQGASAASGHYTALVRDLRLQKTATPAETEAATATPAAAPRPEGGGDEDCRGRREAAGLEALSASSSHQQLEAELSEAVAVDIAASSPEAALQEGLCRETRGDSVAAAEANSNCKVSRPRRAAASALRFGFSSADAPCGADFNNLAKQTGSERAASPEKDASAASRVHSVEAAKGRAGFASDAQDEDASSNAVLQEEEERLREQRLVFKQRSASRVAETDAASVGSEKECARWKWVKFDDSRVSPFAFPVDDDADCEVDPQQAECELFDKNPQGASPESEGPAPSKLSAASASASSPSALPTSFRSRSVYTLIFVRADLECAVQDESPLPSALESLIREEIRLQSSLQRQEAERESLLRDYVLRREALLVSVLGGDLEAELERLRRVQQKLPLPPPLWSAGPFDKARVAAALPSACWEGLCEAGASRGERRPFACKGCPLAARWQPLLEALAFVPRSWWAAFLRGVDFPSAHRMLPRSLAPPRDAANTNAHRTAPLRSLDEADPTEGEALAVADDDGVAASADEQGVEALVLENAEGTEGRDEELAASLRRLSPASPSKAWAAKKKGSLQWTAVVAPDVVEEEAVVDYSAVLCPHALSYSLQKRASLQNAGVASADFWDPAKEARAKEEKEEGGEKENNFLPSERSGEAAETKDFAAAGEEGGLDPTAVWSGELKALPLAVLSRLFKSLELKASVADPRVSASLCVECSEALARLLALHRAQAPLVAALNASVKHQRVILQHIRRQQQQGQADDEAQRGRSACSGGGVCSEETLRGDLFLPPALESTAAEGARQGAAFASKKRRAMHSAETEGAFAVVARRSLSHLFALHSNFLASPLAQRAAFEGGHLASVKFFAEKAAKRQAARRDSQEESLATDASVEDFRKEVAQRRADAEALLPLCDPRLGDGEQSAASDVPAVFVEDLACGVACQHGALLPSSCQRGKAPLRVLVPRRALVEALEFESLKETCWSKLSLRGRRRFSLSCVLNPLSQECRICAEAQQRLVLERQQWRVARREEERLLGPLVGSKWTLKNEGRERTPLSFCKDSALPRTGVYFLLPSSWRVQWLNFVSSADAASAQTAKPFDPDPSELVCTHGGLLVDPSDSVFHPHFLQSPPSSESRKYSLLHEDDLPAFEAFNYSLEALKNLSSLRVKRLETADVLSPTISVAFLRERPCRICVERERRTEGGLFDFEEVDLAIHSPQNCPARQPATGTAKGGGSSSRRTPKALLRKMRVTLSGQTEIQDAVAMVVAAVSEGAENCTSATRVALRVPSSLPRAVHSVGDKGERLLSLEGPSQAALLPLSDLAESVFTAERREAPLRMRELGVLVDSSCCLHFTTDGSDPAAEAPEEGLVMSVETEDEEVEQVEQEQGRVEASPRRLPLREEVFSVKEDVPAEASRQASTEETDQGSPVVILSVEETSSEVSNAEDNSGK